MEISVMRVSAYLRQEYVNVLRLYTTSVRFGRRGHGNDDDDADVLYKL